MVCHNGRPHHYLNGPEYPGTVKPEQVISSSHPCVEQVVRLVINILFILDTSYEWSQIIGFSDWNFYFILGNVLKFDILY